MIQVVGLFLIAMLVLALFGRIRKPGGSKRAVRGKCKSCGAPLIGSTPCPCKKAS
jgi:hypothetical protein